MCARSNFRKLSRFARGAREDREMNWFRSSLISSIFGGKMVDVCMSEIVEGMHGRRFSDRSIEVTDGKYGRILEI